MYGDARVELAEGDGTRCEIRDLDEQPCPDVKRTNRMVPGPGERPEIEGNGASSEAVG